MNFNEYDQQFKKHICENLKYNNSEEFYCTKKENFIFILNEFFSQTKYNINIRVNSLYNIWFDNVKFLFSNIDLNPNSIKIITVNTSQGENNYFKNYFKDNYRVDYCPFNYDGNEHNVMEFITFDNIRYILHYPTDECFRINCFDPNKTIWLNNIFNKIYDKKLVNV